MWKIAVIGQLGQNVSNTSSQLIKLNVMACYHPSCKSIVVQDSSGQNLRPYLKNNWWKRAGGVAQVVELLLAPNSNTNTIGEWGGRWRKDIQQIFVSRMNPVLIAQRSRVNTCLHFLPNMPHTQIDTFEMFFGGFLFCFFIESYCRHMVSENSRKGIAINLLPLQKSQSPLSYSILC
jgi:hypothetical protein